MTASPLTAEAAKVCWTCRQAIPAGGFSRSKRSKDGLQTQCKQCFAEYQRNWLAKVGAKERRVLLMAQWFDKHPGYKKEHRAKNVARDRERRQIHRANNPEVYKARYCIFRLVKSGKIPRAKELTCVTCGKPARHYHHHRGYAREHWEDVIPVCVSCHRKHHSPYDWKL